MANDLSCELCGKGNLNPSTLKIHEKSQAHKAKVEAFEIDNPVDDEPQWPTPIMQVLTDFYENRSNPIDCARAMRQVFASHNWPNREQPSSVRQILERAGVPVYDTPRENVTAGKVRRMRQEQLKQFYREQA